MRIISPELATVKMDYEEKNAGFEKALSGTARTKNGSLKHKSFYS